LANNHVIDWGYSGLLETLETIRQTNIKFAGAGRDLFEARAPAMTDVQGKGRVIVFAFGYRSSGIPPSWRAAEDRPGINLVRELNTESLRAIRDQIKTVKRENDIVVISIHWGSNWGYKIPRKHIIFAHRLIDEAGADIIHGHSSHHVKAIEVYQDKLILYGCGDFLNDYEGISGHEEFRSDLALMYFATVDPATGKLLALHMTPTRIRRFQVIQASLNDAKWLKDTLNREGVSFGVQIKLSKGNRLTLEWK
jgi:poly-gamma-glutamate synthesis protein (capsule biosynthesis protein)